MCTNPETKFKSEMARVLGFYQIGLTANVVHPAQVGNKYHEATFFHEHTHQSLTLGSSLGFLQQLFSKLVYSDLPKETRECFASYVDISLNASIRLHEAVATWWELKWAHGYYGSNAVAELKNGLPDFYRDAFDALDKIISPFNECSFGFMNEHLALRLGHTALNINIGALTDSILSLSPERFRDQITEFSMNPDLRFNSILEALSSHDTRNKFQNHIETYLKTRFPGQDLYSIATSLDERANRQITHYFGEGVFAAVRRYIPNVKAPICQDAASCLDDIAYRRLATGFNKIGIPHFGDSKYSRIGPLEKQ